MRNEHGIETQVVNDWDDLLLVDVDSVIPRRDNYADKVKEVLTEMKVLYVHAVNDLDMGHLDYFGRHYQKIVCEPLPSH